MRVIYELTINGGSNSNSISFAYGNTKTAIIKISHFAASIGVEFSKEVSESYCNALLKEGIKRAALLHLLKYSDTLTIVRAELITIKNGAVISANEYPIAYSFTSLIDSEINIPEIIKPNDFESVMQIKKSDNDRRIAALYAYLLSRSQKIETDIFLYQWIAINGMYAYVWSGKDRDALSKLANQLGIGKIVLCQNDRNRLGKQTMLAINNIEGNVTKDSLTKGDHKQLASDIQNILKDNKTKGFSMTPYGYLILDYGYYVRCNMFHANKPLLVFSFKTDMELKTLEVINGLHKEFLDNNIGKLFDGTLFPEE